MRWPATETSTYIFATRKKGGLKTARLAVVICFSSFDDAVPRAQF